MKLENILKWFLYGIALVPLIIFSQFLSPFHFGKVVIFRSLVEIMLVFYLLLVWRDRSYLIKWDRISKSFLFFALAFTVTTVFSINPIPSFWGTLERMGGLFTFWHYFAYFVILVSVFKKREDWMRLFKLMIIVGLMSAFYGFGQKTDSDFFIGSGNRARIFGTIGNAALFGGYQLLVLFLSLTLFFKKISTQNEKFLYGLGIVISAIAVLMTAVRGSILAMSVGLLLFFMLQMMLLNSKQAKKIFLGLLLVGILFSAFALVFHDSAFVSKSGYLTRLTSFSLNNYTVQTRFWAWQAGINGWNDSIKTIIVGWGPENFNIPFSRYFNPNFFTGPGSETFFDRAHNMFVEVLVTMGLVGFLAYVAIFVATMASLWRVIKDKSQDTGYGIGLISLVVAYVIHNLFIFDTSANFITFFTILGFIRFISLPTVQVAEPRALKQPRPILYKTAAILMFAVAVVSVYKINIVQVRSNYTTTRAIVRGWDKDFNGAVEKYKEALSLNSPQQYEIRHRMAQFVLDFVSSGKINKEREDVLKFVVNEVEKNMESSKLDYLPHLYLSRLNIVLGKADPSSPYNDKALEHANKALEISPTFVRTYYEIAQVYLNKKDFTTAIDYFKKAVELAPNVGVSYWYWGATELELGHTQEGIKLMESALAKEYAPNENDLVRLVNVYIKLNDLPRLMETFEKLVVLKPNNAQYRASLAAVYVQAGRIDEAVKQAREAARIDASYIPEAKAFVERLGRVW